jgi:hypothetical protein
MKDGMAFCTTAIAPNDSFISLEEFMRGAIVIPNKPEPVDMTPRPNGGIYATDFEALTRKHQN